MYMSNKRGMQSRQLLSYWLTDYGIIGLADGSNSGRCQCGVYIPMHFVNTRN